MATKDESSKEQKVSYMSLSNKGQLALCCLARSAEPIAMASIQSYMYYQLKFFDPSASDATISTQAGILISARTAAQVCTGMLWGRFADSELGGRKVTLVIGLTSCGIAFLGYGLARSFNWAIFWQVFGGAMSSNIALVRCVVAELNPEKRYRTRALLLLPLFANIGTLLGPLVGGLLSDNTSGSLRSQHPYLLPNLVVCVIYFTSALGMAIWLHETLASLQDAEETVPQRYWRRIRRYIYNNGQKTHLYRQLEQDETQSRTAPEVEMVLSPTSPQSARAPFIPKNPTKKKKLPFRKIWTFNVICTMVSHFIIGGHLGTFASLWAIFLSTPISNPSEQHSPLKFNGGLGMLPRDVGFAMSLLGGIGVVLQMFFYPALQDRFGTIKIWRSTLFIFPVVYLLAPYPSLVASATALKGKTALVWISMCAVLFLYVLGRTGVTPATTLLINDCTPHPSVRGTIHTTATGVNNLARSIFPLIAMTIFGQGMRVGVVGLGFWSIAALAILSCITSRWVVEGSNGKEIVLEDEEEEEPQTLATPAAPTSGQV